jgi:putative transposase
MRKRRFSVEQMIGALKQSEVGVPVAEVIRKTGISEQTFTDGRRSMLAWK